MGKRIVISENEKLDILNKYNILNEELNRNNDGQIIANKYKYNIFVDGTQRYYGGRDGEKYKICTSPDIDGWTTICKSINIKPENVNYFNTEMSKGVPVVKYTTPDGKKIEFKKS